MKGPSMSSAAEQAAAVFKANGNTWQERPVRPPPYTPTVEQIDALFADLLSQVVVGKAHNVTNTIYHHSAARDLRVVRLTGLKEEQQRFALQVQTAPTGSTPAYQSLAIVDADGNDADWVPAPKAPPESKDELRAQVADLEKQLAEHRAQLADLSARIDGEN